MLINLTLFGGFLVYFCSMRFERALFTGALCILARKQMKNLFRIGKIGAVKARIESVAVCTFWISANFKAILGLHLLTKNHL